MNIGTAFRHDPTSADWVGTAEATGSPPRPDRPDAGYDRGAENGGQRSVIRGWLARLPVVDSPEVITAWAAWLLHFVDDAWATWHGTDLAQDGELPSQAS